MFKQAIIALAIASVSAESFKASSPKGRALLKKARVIQPSRHLRKLEDREDYDWNQYQNEEDQEFDVAQLSLKYLGCSEWTTAYNNWAEDQDQQAQQYYYQDQQEGQEGQYNGQQQEGEDQQEEERDDGLDSSSLVRFTLCTDGCGTCDGEFAVDMAEFIDAYTESKMTTLEYQCEIMAERCYCQNGNWEQCFYDCYQQADFDLYGTDAGVQYCLSNYYGYEQFEVQRYLECAEVEQAEENNNGQNQYNQGQYNQEQEEMQYYVGPTCVDNQYIYLAAFYDEDCTYKAENAKFASENYGSSFPYFKESIISPNECITCQETESYYEMKQAIKQAQYYQNNYQNNQANYGGDGQQQENQNNYYWGEDMDYGDANEVCGTWEDAVKCDSSRGFNSGCTFLDTTLPSLDGRGTHEKFKNTFDRTKDSLKKNKNIAIAMGVIAAVLLAALAFTCGLCGGSSDNSKKIALLEKKRTGEEDGAIA